MTTRIELQHDGDTVSRVRFVSENGIPLLGKSTREELVLAVSELEARPQCRVAVFEAEGRVFIAGADINELQALNADSAEQLSHAMHALFDRIERLPAVTIAALHGACAGGGFELALACDLRYAATSAKLGLPEVTLGLIPGWGGTVRAARLFGPAAARSLILRGELLSAAEALQRGIVHGVAADEEFREFVQSQVDLINQRSPAAVRLAKQCLLSFQQETSDAFGEEARRFGDCYRTSDAAEGIAAFLEKRPPHWPG